MPRSVSQNLANRRLRALLTELGDEGLLLRRRQPNQKGNPNDPTWQYVYRLADPAVQLHQARPHETRPRQDSAFSARFDAQ